MPAPKPDSLPNPRHARRLPPHLTAEALHRIRQASYHLPQVVSPSDFVDEHTADFEDRLDEMGLVQLQVAVPGARPSRWIDPALIDVALAQLDALAAQKDKLKGKVIRAVILERTAVLETLGILRRGNAWERNARQVLVVPSPGWDVPVFFTVPQAADPVWAFYRDGDKAALIGALGDPPPYEEAEAVVSHLDALARHAAAHRPKQLATLLPALAAECAKPQPLDALVAGCSRALVRWEHRVAELDTLDSLNSELAFQGYPDSFPKARRLDRRVRLFVGPPNSGKTHAAFERLATAGSGTYLAPLRLLALEGRDRLVGRGVACSLLTGEENVPIEGAHVVSSTIEMVGTNKPVDVAVIDEAQMIFDGSRGWAWTQAIVAVPAKEVIIICSAYAVPAIENLLGLCGETPEVVKFQRKQHVQLMPAPVPLAALKKGDAVVAFSRRDVLSIRDRIAAANGLSVSVIYGALPPEVRRREAERFATGEAHVLVATDAIGMGLNLPIRRVLFSTMTKYDGQSDRELTESEVHQIAGRAGRYGMHEEGFTTVLAEAEPSAMKTLRELLPKSPRAPRNFKAPVAPNGWHIDTISSRLGKNRLREVLGIFMGQLQLDNAHFEVAELEQMLELADQLDRIAPKLTLRERFTYAQAPVDSRTDSQVQQYLGWAENHARSGTAGVPWFLDSVDEHSRLDRMEQALRSCTLWLWLDLRFPGVYGHVDDVVALRERLNDGIERQLKGKKPLAFTRSSRR
jgi:ATP-dependent RNA helicase SUPV3L1/SUV3